MKYFHKSGGEKLRCCARLVCQWVAMFPLSDEAAHCLLILWGYQTGYLGPCVNCEHLSLSFIVLTQITGCLCQDCPARLSLVTYI